MVHGTKSERESPVSDIGAQGDKGPSSILSDDAHGNQLLTTVYKEAKE